MKRKAILFLPLLVLLAATTVVMSAAPRLTLPNAKWVAWKVPTATDVKICSGGWNHRGSCCGWGDDQQGFSINDEPGSGTMTLAARVNGGTIEKIRMFDGSCDISRKDGTLVWMQNVDPESSLDLLEEQIDRADADSRGIITAMAQHAGSSVEPRLEKIADSRRDEDVREQAIFWIGQRGGERGYQYLTKFIRSNDDESLLDKAVFSLSQSSASGAMGSLIDFARHHKSSEVREKALFWLGQKAGEKAASELRRAVDEDPDDDVREKAVFAISQLPPERSVPMLIDLVKNHKSPNVRKKAMFWLTQTGDPRALDLIEQIVLH
ncbi:MAG TPA: HEAT repeat domain-containing protein [Thermoanaerobaculia bacterium]|nr:HEAT repeat domain-containing protein [Thermoanaerobaculia bacterium]